jgi:hypothetical protein
VRGSKDYFIGVLSNLSQRHCLWAVSVIDGQIGRALIGLPD